MSLQTKTYLFQDLTTEEQHHVQALAQHKVFAPGETLITEGMQITEVFVILTGAVEIKKTAPSQQQLHRVASLSEGETIGEMGLLDLEPASATVIAMSKTEVLAFPISTLRAAGFFFKDYGQHCCPFKSTIKSY